MGIRKKAILTETDSVSVSECYNFVNGIPGYRVEGNVTQVCGAGNVGGWCATDEDPYLDCPCDKGAACGGDGACNNECCNPSGEGPCYEGGNIYPACLCEDSCGNCGGPTSPPGDYNTLECSGVDSIDAVCGNGGQDNQDGACPQGYTDVNGESCSIAGCNGVCCQGPNYSSCVFLINYR